MHNLALHIIKGYKVTGSDDAIFEPSKSRLDKREFYLLNWVGSQKKITNDIETVILGMHASKDNPEL
jgi:UDP-N-acetylmuramate: L-alanyl-gamma-D-glutamyl-meso-diaminopimelate ligase